MHIIVFVFLSLRRFLVPTHAFLLRFLIDQGRLNTVAHLKENQALKETLQTQVQW